MNKMIIKGKMPWSLIKFFLYLFIFIYVITSTIWCGTHNRARLQFKCVLKDNPPSPGKLGHTAGFYTSPTLFEQWCGFFYVPQEPDKWRCCGTGTTVFRPYPRRLESLTVCRCHCKGSTFSSVILRTLSVGPAWVWTRDLPLSRPALSQMSQPGGGKFMKIGLENLYLDIGAERVNNKVKEGWHWVNLIKGKVDDEQKGITCLARESRIFRASSVRCVETACKIKQYVNQYNLWPLVFPLKYQKPRENQCRVS